MNMNNEIISFEVMTCILYNFEDFFHIHVCLLFTKYSEPLSVLEFIAGRIA